MTQPKNPTVAELRASGRYVLTYTRPFKFPGEAEATPQTCVYGDYADRPGAEAGLRELQRQYYWRADHKAEILEPTTGAADVPAQSDFTFELTPCGSFLGVRWEGDVIGMVTAGAPGVWRARSKGGTFDTGSLLEACGWLLSRHIGLPWKAVTQ